MNTGLRRYGALLAGLAVGGALMTLAACGGPSPAATVPTGGGPVVQQAIKIVNSDAPATNGWQQYQPAVWTVPHAGDTVVVTITSYDDGTSPLPAGSPYAQVAGTTNGTESVDGTVVSAIPVDQVAHTFTIPTLGVNLVVPAAPKGGSVTVQAAIRFTKAGTYYWHCAAPCGTGPDGLGGPMTTDGWMQGTVTVQS